LALRVGRVTAAREAGITAMQVYVALKEMIAELGLTAVAVGCYPHLMGKVCLPISLLADQGIPVACEGDVNGALGMIMLNFLTGGPVHNTDLLDPVPADNAIVYSHCGNGSFTLAESQQDITLGPVRG
jgi:L-fucose isomerase-like protein